MRADSVRLGRAGHLQPQRPRAARHTLCGRRVAHPQPAAGFSSACAQRDARRCAGPRRGLWHTQSPRSRRGGKHDAGGYLFKHKSLAKVFRARVLDAVERSGLTRPDKLPGTWVVDCRCVGDGSKALPYLGRYRYRGVIQETDILRCEDNGQVSFRYRDAKTSKAAVLTLPGANFLWLVLQHVLPKVLRRARNFGFLHPNSAGAIRLLQALHLSAAPAHVPPAPPRAAWRCVCGQPMFVVCRRNPALQPDVSVIRPDNPDASQSRTTH